MRRLLTTFACLLLAASLFAKTEEELREDLFPSTPEQIATLTNEPSYLIAGLINPLSGQYALRETDLIVKGAQNIILSRNYTPPYMPCSFSKHKDYQEEHDKKDLCSHLYNHYKGWQFFAHVRLEFIPSLMEIRLAEPNGMTLDFRLSGPEFSTTSLVSPPYAISNMAGDMPSAKFDPRNTRIAFEENRTKIIVHATDGTTRIYRYKGLATTTSYFYLLEKEELSNGRILKYHYNGRNQPYYIESLDPKERYVYASLRISGTPSDGACHFLSSSGMNVDYTYEIRPIEWKIRNINGIKGKETYKGFYPPILSSVSSPSYRQESFGYCGRFLLCSCLGKEHVFNTLNAPFGEEEKHYRIHQLLLPVGEKDVFVPVYEISYQPPIAGQKEGTTTIKNSDGTSLIYHFSKNLLLTLIEYFDKEKILKKEKVLSWDDKHWLKFVEIRDGQKKLLHRRSYEYDHFGNPILETLTGDLTGEGTETTFITKRTFSEDGRNLLLREESEDGKVLCYSYLPSTNLISSKLTKKLDQIILRDFFLYNDCNHLIQKISDDGESEDKDILSNVTQRTLTTYTLRQAAPFLHMPEWIEETYLEAGTEKLLKKSHLLYDLHGNIAEERVYDADSKHVYTIEKTYNERGDVLTETNRFGHKTTYTYNSKGQIETHSNFSNRIQKIFHYDTKGRLKILEEKGNDQVNHITSSEYDFHDRKSSQKDIFQNETHYTYDLLVKQIEKTDFPSIASIDNQKIPVSTLSSYDSFGHMQTKTDANGNVTTYRYNAYGSPTEINYPNGGKETFRYEKNGQLSCHTDLDGLSISYKRDVLGQVLRKTYASADGKTIAEEIFTYKGFNLLAETNKEGHVKKFSYDGVGRIIQEEFCNRITKFSYNSLGFLKTIYQQNGNNDLLITYSRDLEGKVLEKIKTDISERILYKIGYSYDLDGNKKTITRYINGKEAIDTFVYDSFGRSIQHQDSEGFITNTTYNENFTNSLRQKVLQTKTIDPQNIVTLKTQDALNRTAKIEVLNAQDIPIAGHELIHDAQGNLLYRKDHIYEDQHLRKMQTIKYSYTSDHQVETLTRGFGTNDVRTTTYTYFPSGKMKTKTLPDGITLSYHYEPLGFLSCLDSSDGQIHHTFTYDKLGHLHTATDKNHHLAIKREVDPFGNITKELFPLNFEMKKEYDSLGRLTTLQIADQGKINYTYDPCFLKEVTRISKDGNTLYSHNYGEYDLNGNLTSETLIGNLGHVTHITESRGQKASISSPYFTQKCSYNSVGNLITNIIDKSEFRYSYDDLSQLSSEDGLEQPILYTYDSLYNRIQKNGRPLPINELNELSAMDGLGSLYDLNGNQILSEIGGEIARLIYDPLNRLTEVCTAKKKLQFTYDPLGRRFSKAVYSLSGSGWKEQDHEYYLYDNLNEIGAYTSTGGLKNLRILGLSNHENNPLTIGIEVHDQIFAPLLDVQGNIRRLVDLGSRSVAASYNFTAFGEALPVNSQINVPWQFASKRYDPDLNLIYFGQRYYDPRLGRWLTTDPAGFVDSPNLYQYVLNNPFRYCDPRGDSIGEYFLGLGEIICGGALMLTGGIIELGSFGALTFGFALAETAGIALIGHGLSLTNTHAKDIQIPRISWKNIDVYAPDRPLPLTDDGIPIPDTDAPHTQIGTKESKRRPGEKYPQAREFDKDGKPVKTIDFTDHGEPLIHPNPHEHVSEPNPTGGTSRRGEAKPLSNWEY